MPRTGRQKMQFVLAILFAAVPLAFALIRAIVTGSDLRALWMAAATFPATSLITAIWKRRSGSASLAFGVVLFTVCTLLAAAVATLFGAHAAFGVWAVAIAFGFCVAMATVLLMRSMEAGQE